MAEVFTREALADILGAEELTAEQRAEWLLALHGQAIEEGFVPREAAEARQSEAYRALRGEYDAYRAMQEARSSAEYARVKPKFFETVYGLVDRGEGARPVGEQLAAIREGFEEYFIPEGGTGRSAPAVVLPVGSPPAPAGRMTLSEAMRRANAGEAVDVGRIG